MRNISLILFLVVVLLCGCVESKQPLESVNDGIVELGESGSDDMDEREVTDFVGPMLDGSQVSEGYYGDTYGLSGEDLKAVLNDIISEGYGALSYDQVYDALEDTDEDPEDPSKVILFYKGVSVGDSGLRMSDDGDIWNREHIWAKSHGDFGTDRGPGTDLHMIRPTDASVNARRGHLDFDYSDQVFSEAPDTYVDEDSFEPRDEVKGDVARMLFYIAVRYEGENGEVDLELANRVGTYYMTDTGYGEHGKLETLLEWHELDPVDDIERTRNDVIYRIQGNRNPFIDHPEFVAMIWDDFGVMDGASSNESNQEQNLGQVRLMDDGKGVTVAGLITFVESDTSMYIEDASGGIRVDSHGSNYQLDDYQVGQKIRVSGYLDSFKGEKELMVDSDDDIMLTDITLESDKKIASISDLSEGMYQGMKVSIEDVRVIEINYNSLMVEDQDGNRLNIYFASSKGIEADDFTLNAYYDIEGIASYFKEVQVKLIDNKSFVEVSGQY